MRIKGIKVATVRKPNGKTYRYFYHRKTNTKIAAAYGTAAFSAEVAALDARAQQNSPRDGSLHALIVAYKQSPQFTRLEARTQQDYNRIINFFAKIGHMPLAELTTPFIFRLQDVALRKHKVRFANYVVQVLRTMLSWGKPRGFVETNTAMGVKLLPRPKDKPRANRTWTDEEREIVLAAASIELKAMIALGMYAGLREGDACKIGKTAYNGTHIECVASKNREVIWLPVSPRLRVILDELTAERSRKLLARSLHRKVVPMDPPTLTVTSRGHSWTESGFRASFFKLIRKLVEAGQVKPGLTFHGLRHTMGKRIIEAGGSKEDVKMVLADKTDAMGEHYSREFEKKGRVGAMMLRLEQSEREKMENFADENGKLKSPSFTARK